MPGESQAPQAPWHETSLRRPGDAVMAKAQLLTLRRERATPLEQMEGQTESYPEKQMSKFN